MEPESPSEASFGYPWKVWFLSMNFDKYIIMFPSIWHWEYNNLQGGCPSRKSVFVHNILQLHIFTIKLLYLVVNQHILNNIFLYIFSNNISFIFSVTEQTSARKTPCGWIETCQESIFLGSALAPDVTKSHRWE